MLLSLIIIALTVYVYLFNFEIEIKNSEGKIWFLEVEIVLPLIFLYSVVSLFSFYYLSPKHSINSDINKTKKEIELLKLQKELNSLKDEKTS